MGLVLAVEHSFVVVGLFRVSEAGVGNVKGASAAVAPKLN